MEIQRGNSTSINNYSAFVVGEFARGENSG